MKKFLTLLLALVMALSLIPTMAMAATSGISTTPGWWPVYWGFESGTQPITSDDITVTTATGANVTFAANEKGAREAFNDSSACTIGSVGGSFQVTVPEGYYVEGYRIVCGNHTGCGITKKSDIKYLDNHSATVSLSVNEADLQHWKKGNSTLPSDFANKPSSYDWWYAFDSIYYNANQYFPYYLLISVKEDTTRYNATYNWGELSEKLEAAVPSGPHDLKRNSTYTVAQPSAEAIAAATALGYEFTGWKLNDSSETVGETVNVTGDLSFTAQWNKLPEYTVTWQAGDHGKINDGTADVTGTHVTGATYPAAPTTTPDTHYAFDGWTKGGEKVTTFPATVTESATYVATWKQVSTDPTSHTTFGVKYIVEYYLKDANGDYVKDETHSTIKRAELANKDATVDVKETPESITGYVFNETRSTTTGTVKLPKSDADIVTLKLYYDFAPITVQLGSNNNEKPWVLKDLKGNLPRGFKDIFTVTLTPVNNIVPAPKAMPKAVALEPQPITGTVTMNNAGKGVFEFKNEEGLLTFTEPGTYEFTIKETAGKTRNMTYDKNPYTLTINVTLGDNGLVADAKPITVTNTYRVPSTPSTPTTPVEKVSPKTADAGIAIYGVLSVMSVLGTGLVIGKKKEF